MTRFFFAAQVPELNTSKAKQEIWLLEVISNFKCYFNLTGVGICKKKLRLKFAWRAGILTWTFTKLVLFTPESNNWLLDGKINRPFPAFIFSPESLWRLYLPSVMDSCPAVNDVVLSSGTVKANTESATFSRVFIEIFTSSLPCRNFINNHIM